MKRKKIFLITSVLLLLAIPAVLLLMVFLSPPQYDETYLAGLGVKWERLNGIKGRKIVIAGGSGVAFDFNSQLLEDDIEGYSVVNFGLYAGLGTTVMLDLAVKEMNEGDILIFAPEMSAQTLSTFFGAESMWQATDAVRSPVLSLTWDYAGDMAGAFPRYAGSKISYLVNGNKPHGDGVYSYSSFDTYGDIACAGRETNRMSGGYDPNMMLDFEPEMFGDDFIEKIESIHRECDNKGVKFCFALCPMNRAAFLKDAYECAERYRSALEDTLGIPVIGDPYESIMDPEWFYDTNFHLNESGMTVATYLMSGAIKKYIGDETRSLITLPDKPESTYFPEPVIEGNDRDEDIFEYTPVENGYFIVKIKDSAENITEVIIPVSHNGKPVTGFSENVFRGLASLREVTIQKNITVINDGSFDGCVSLEKINIDNPKPGTCSVGAGLLSGTDACVYVPSDKYGEYCTSYFWAVHSSRIRSGAADSGGEVKPPEITDDKPDNTEKTRKGNDILYDSNGGKLKRGEGSDIIIEAKNTHLRENTLQGSRYFERDGFVLVGWNTKADGTGTSTGLGSRIGFEKEMTLFAEWKKETEEENFEYDNITTGIEISKYIGKDEICVIPEKINGIPVVSIASGAFAGNELAELVLPPSIRGVEKHAFDSCKIERLIFFDGITEIYDDSFHDCTGPSRIRINALTAPVFSGSYYDTFSDKYDYLLSIKDKKKIVLASGSSGRYGYDSEMISEAFPEYEVVNMGVYAYSNALPQLDIILHMMEEGDVLLSAPEFDAIKEQFCTTDMFDHHFWAMLESDYDMISNLDLREYTGVFDSYREYRKIKSGMSEKDYSVSPSNYDDDGNYYSFSTYNTRGDFILPRPNGTEDKLQNRNIADYNVDSFPEEYIKCINQEYEKFEGKGVEVLFSYTPRNHSSLTERSTVESRAELHEYLKNNLCVPVISDIEDYLMSGIYFWLIDSHTSTEGASIRTEKIISDLTDYFEKK